MIIRRGAEPVSGLGVTAGEFCRPEREVKSACVCSNVPERRLKEPSDPLLEDLTNREPANYISLTIRYERQNIPKG